MPDTRPNTTFEVLNNLPVWQRMATVTLAEMQGVKLMNRVDTKYVLSVDEVLDLLDRAAVEGYKVQLIGQCRACRYNTLYYDTAERDMYLVHHNRRLTRQKIRTRTYVESGVSFLEIKNKSNRGRTRKRRVGISAELFHGFSEDAAAMAFFSNHAWYDIGRLTPALRTRFTRITLINPAFTERLTIDLDLRYCDVRSGREAHIDNMAIVELKQDGLAESVAKQMLQDMRIQPCKVSKYCLGTSLTVADIKRNRYKEKLRTIELRLKRGMPTARE